MVLVRVCGTEMSFTSRNDWAISQYSIDSVTVPKYATTASYTIDFKLRSLSSRVTPITC